MCGIAGIFDPRLPVASTLQNRIAAMTASLAHRGPDDSGEWMDATCGVALGHRRLSIVDLSPEGHQPMASSGQRYIIVFNGEVYNFPDLRSQLEALGRGFSGRSDTEVMLAAMLEWGVEAAIQKFVGMFAFGLWDQAGRTLWLCRDRLGIKPLYYGWTPSGFLFASELKAFCACPGFNGSLDREALSHYLRLGYIPQPFTIYKGVQKLPPGCLLKLECGVAGQRARPQVYWDVAEAFARGVAKPFPGTDAEAVDQLDVLLRDAVRLRMVADVPLGAFLSGGIDSSTVVALMQAQSLQRVKTFTIGFREDRFDEAGQARDVARHLGTNHTEHYLTATDALEIIPRLPVLFDEPFADSSQIPSFLVSRLARQSVTVSLSGDGGDELLGGYTRYLSVPHAWAWLSKVPHPVRRVAARILLQPAAWLGGTAVLGSRSRAPEQGRGAADKLQRLPSLAAAAGIEGFYDAVMTQWPRPPVESQGESGLDSLRSSNAGLPQAATRLMLMDFQRYLPDDILVKLDRASMAVSLEARVPLLDHRLVEFAATLPLALKIRHGHGKWLLRQVLYRYLPQPMVDLPKRGFNVPVAAWLRGPLREWAEALLEPERLKREGWLSPAPIRRLWRDHLAFRRNGEHELWAVLMFQAWLEKQRSG
jgi:asparagine synthase (glutamine-hydrolysing)